MDNWEEQEEMIGHQLATKEIKDVQSLVNERDELEHRKLAAGDRAMKYPKDSYKRDLALQQARACAERIEEVDKLLNHREE